MLLSIFLFFAFSCFFPIGSDVSIRETIILTKSEQQHLRNLISNNPNVNRMWKQINKEAQSLLDEVPHPLEKIHYEGLLHNHPKRIITQKSLEDMDKVATWLSGFYGSGDKVYVHKIKEFILAWVNDYKPTGNPINENKLEPLIHSFHVLRDSFLQDEHQLVYEWLVKIAEKEIANTRIPHNNWKAKQIKLVGTIGLVIENTSYVTYAIDEYRNYVDKALYGNGTSRDLLERDALSYHVSGLDPLLTFSIILDQTDKDHNTNLFRYTNQEGGSVKKSVDFVLPYVMGEKEYAQWMTTKVRLDKERARAGMQKYQPGTLFEPISALDTYELAYYFDPDYKKVLMKLTGVSANYPPSWLAILIDVARTIK